MYLCSGAPAAGVAEAPRAPRPVRLRARPRVAGFCAALPSLSSDPQAILLLAFMCNSRRFARRYELLKCVRSCHVPNTSNIPTFIAHDFAAVPYVTGLLASTLPWPLEREVCLADRVLLLKVLGNTKGHKADKQCHIGVRLFLQLSTPSTERSGDAISHPEHYATWCAAQGITLQTAENSIGRVANTQRHRELRRHLRARE